MGLTPTLVRTYMGGTLEQHQLSKFISNCVSTTPLKVSL